MTAPPPLPRRTVLARQSTEFTLAIDCRTAKVVDWHEGIEFGSTEDRLVFTSAGPQYLKQDIADAVYGFWKSHDTSTYVAEESKWLAVAAISVWEAVYTYQHTSATPKNPGITQNPPNPVGPFGTIAHVDAADHGYEDGGFHSSHSPIGRYAGDPIQ